MPDFKFQISDFRFLVPPGFTLLEVMIALAVISIALMALLGSQSQGLSLGNESRFNTTASLLAQAKMAEIEAIRDQRDLASDSGYFGEEFPDYAWQLSVHDVSFDGAPTVSNRLKCIDLDVSYVPNGRYRCQFRLYRFFP
ncbi:MAG: ral secretion pathway protein [Thermodesulfobacteriota bacterium]|nr:ral secretion pathway protein [Thermodesulfobacteriota bacterium]